MVKPRPHHHRLLDEPWRASHYGGALAGPTVLKAFNKKLAEAKKVMKKDG